MSFATAARPSSCRSPLESRPDPVDLAERFAPEHEQRYGHRDPEGEVVLVHIRLAMVAPGPRPAADGSAEEAASKRAPATCAFDGDWVETLVLRGEPAAGLAEGTVRLRAARGNPCPAAGLAREVDDGGTIARPSETRRDDAMRQASIPVTAAGDDRRACAPPATRWAQS